MEKLLIFFITYTKGNSLNILYYYSVFLAIFLGVVHFFKLSIVQIYFRLSNELKAKINVDGFKKLLEQSLSQHSKENTGSKYQKIQNGINAFNLFTEALNDRIIPTIATTIGVFVVFFYINFIYNIVLIAYIIGFIIILRFFRKKFTTLSHEKNLAMEKSSSTYIESLSNVATIKSSGAENAFKSSVTKKRRST